MHIKREICCTKPLLVRDGFLVCTECGKMHRQHVTPQMISFTQNFAPVHASYSRSKRFRTKMMSALRLQMHYTLDKSLVSWLKNAESEGTLKTPEDLLFHIAQYPVSKNQRRPYLYAMYYWRALGKDIPQITTQELNQLCQEFDRIFFAFRRLNLPKPDFPYAYLFRKIVKTSAYSKDVVMMTRFVRKLQCQVRQKRYHELYMKCQTSSKCSLWLVNERGENRRDRGDSEPEPSSAGQYIVSRQNVKHYHNLDPMDVKNVYRSEAQMNRAIKNGTFNIAKTMHMDFTTKNIYWLCYENTDA